MDTRRWVLASGWSSSRTRRKPTPQTIEWITSHDIFAAGRMENGCYEDSVISLQATK